MKELGLASSNGDARRTIEQGGLSVNGAKVTDPRTNITMDDFRDGEILIQKGKKKFVKVTVK